MLPLNQLQWAFSMQMQQLMQQQAFMQQQPVQLPGTEETDNEDEEQRTLFCANLDERVDDELLYELFLQAGPLENVRMPKQRSFAFITYIHACSPVYAMHLFQGLMLFGKTIVIKYHNRTNAPQLTRRLLPPDWGLMDKKASVDYPSSMIINDQHQSSGDHRRHDRSPVRTRNDRDRDSAHDWTRGSGGRERKPRSYHSTGPYERHRDSSRERDRDHDRNRRSNEFDRHRRQDKRSSHYM